MPPSVWQPLGSQTEVVDFVDSSRMDTLYQAISYQVDYLVEEINRHRDQPIVVAGRRISPFVLQSKLTELMRRLEAQPSNRELSRWLQANFDIYHYQAPTHDGRLLVTSYYAPEFQASPVPDQKFRFPIYPPPDDLEPGRPYRTRYAIDYKNALKEKVLPLAYLESEMDRFFLHIQGSGILLWPDGSRDPVGYAGNNGHDYVSLGRLMRQDGTLAKIGGGTMDKLRGYFEEQPQEFEKYARKMPRYIFFRFKDKVRGALGLPVSPLRTIAVDDRQIPMGLLAYLKTRQPIIDKSGRLTDWQPLSLLVLSQDRGADIKGAHIDLFWGNGKAAGDRAGKMQERGTLYLLLPKEQKKVTDPAAIERYLQN